MEESAAEDYEFLTGLGPVESMGERGRTNCIAGVAYWGAEFPL